VAESDKHASLLHIGVN